MTARAPITVDTLTRAVRIAETSATEYAETVGDISRSERNSYAYACLLGALSAHGVDVDAIRAEFEKASA